MLQQSRALLAETLRLQQRKVTMRLSAEIYYNHLVAEHNSGIAPQIPSMVMLYETEALREVLTRAPLSSAVIQHEATGVTALVALEHANQMIHALRYATSHSEFRPLISAVVRYASGNLEPVDGDAVSVPAALEKAEEILAALEEE